jgi:hypothetical protein
VQKVKVGCQMASSRKSSHETKSAARRAITLGRNATKLFKKAPVLAAQGPVGQNAEQSKTMRATKKPPKFGGFFAEGRTQRLNGVGSINLPPTPTSEGLA